MKRTAAYCTLLAVFLLQMGCAGTRMIEKNGYTHQIDYGHVTPFAAYTFSHSYDENGKLVGTNLVNSNSLGEMTFDGLKAFGFGYGAYLGLKGINTGSNVSVQGLGGP